MAVELFQDAVRVGPGIVAERETILIEVCMGHEWILEVLRDLSSYARANGLAGLASKADEALRVAQVEIDAAGQRPLDETGGMTAKGKAH